MAHGNGEAATVRQEMTLRTASRLTKEPGQRLVQEWQERGWPVLVRGRGKSKRYRVYEDDVAQYQREAEAADGRQDKARADLIAEMVREGIGG